MPVRLIAYALLSALLMAATASAQSNPPGGYPQPSGQNVQPDQPVQPQLPTVVPRGAQPGGQQPARQLPPTSPFALTPQEQAQVQQVLVMWEQRNSKVKTFDAGFRRWVYDAVFGRPDEPKFIDLGVIKYAAPDRGMFRLDTTTGKDGREVPIEDARAEHWISDGKAIIEYNHVKKQVIVHKLPPEMQGKAIADGPLPFLFGSDAKKLQQRYFLRIVTPRGVQGQIWLQAYPRFQQDAANFHHANFIITDKMEPYALEMIQPNGNDKIVYRFYDIVINDPLRMFRGDPFRETRPTGWQKIVEEPQSQQARRPANDGRR
jgi:TIGR03009 family protein